MFSHLVACVYLLCLGGPESPKIRVYRDSCRSFMNVLETAGVSDPILTRESFLADEEEPAFQGV